MENLDEHKISLCMGNDGIERSFAWLHLAVDKHGLANGAAVMLENNWNNNSYKITKVNYVHGFQVPDSSIVLKKENDEVLSLTEFCEFVTNERIIGSSTARKKING